MPVALAEFMLLLGQSAIRPCDGPAVGESVTLQRVVPGQRADAVAEERSVVAEPHHPSTVGPFEGGPEVGRPRVERAPASSTASLKPNVPAHG